MKPSSVPKPVEGERLVWVFHSDDARSPFPSGVWSDRKLAEAWIHKVAANGTLSAYVLDESAYDSNVRLGLLDIEKAARTDASFIRKFTTAVNHVHFSGASTSAQATRDLS